MNDFLTRYISRILYNNTCHKTIRCILYSRFTIFKDRITGQDFYLTQANKAASYCINNLIDKTNNVLKDEGNGDGGLFKGIFVRYFTKLLLEEDLKESDRERYLAFFNNNAKVLYEKGRSAENLYSSNWTKPGDWSNDMPTQVSGCMMIEAKAWYEKVKASE